MGFTLERIEYGQDGKRLELSLATEKGLTIAYPS